MNAPPPPAIELIDLSKQYGSRAAVSQLKLQVYPADIFGFVGPNGSGKTTTIRMIAGLLNPTSGQVFVEGFSSGANSYEVRRRIGYMPDDFGVYPDLKVWEYLDFFSACYDIPPARRADLTAELLDLVDLTARRDDPVDRLSRGLKQRLSLARALIHDPHVLILDEPAAGLDPRARIEIRLLLLELSRMGKTIFFSTHILSDVAEICNRVAIIEEGQLVAAGRIEDLQLQHLRRRKIQITLLDRLEQTLAILQADEQVSQIEPVPSESNNGRLRVRFDFESDDAALSELLRRFVQAEIPILHFGEEGSALEEVFLQTTRGVIS